MRSTLPDRRNSGCCLALLSTVPQIRYGASGRKPAQTRQKKNDGFFLGSSQPKHNHEPQTDTAKHQRALIPTRRKMAIYPQGGQSTAPLARSRSLFVTKRHKTPRFDNFASHFRDRVHLLKKVPLGVRLISTRRRPPRFFLSHKCPCRPRARGKIPCPCPGVLIKPVLNSGPKGCWQPGWLAESAHGARACWHAP